jgi:protein phosphatase
MAGFVVRVGCYTAQGLRSKNEDRFVVDRKNNFFLVADGMGGQEMGEKASGLAADIIPRALQARLAKHQDPGEAVQAALQEANEAIISAGQDQPSRRRMGTTAVLAVQQDDHVYVAGLGDSRACLVRHGRVEQLTVDHTVADALERSGTLTPGQARTCPYRHVLYKFLGCVEMSEGAEVRPFAPQPGDRLILASDGLTSHVTDDDLIDGDRDFASAQAWCEHLVRTALDRGSRDNVTCVVVAFDRE